MKISRNEGLAMVAAAGFGIMGWLLYRSEKKLRDKEQKFNVDLNTLKHDMSEEVRKGVHDEVIREAIVKGVEAKVDTILKQAKVDAISAAKKEIDTSVSNTVQSTWDLMKSNVERDLLAKVGEIDTTEIKREATEQARDKAVLEATSSVDKMIEDIREKFDQRANETIKRAESKFSNKLDSTISSLKDRYQTKLWDSILNG